MARRCQPKLPAAALAGKGTAATDRPVVGAPPVAAGPALKQALPPSRPSSGDHARSWTLSGFSLVTNLVPARAVGLGDPGHPTEQPPWYQARRVQRTGGEDGDADAGEAVSWPSEALLLAGEA